jgi:primosomal protein N'
VEEAVTALFPQARIARIDAEDLRTSAEERRVDEAIGSQAEILIASPMIAKGPPLPGFTLAGAIGVDALLSRPDFRAAEWAYQYVRGLAGRLEGGEVLVQTRYPEHPALLATTRRDYERLFDEEGAVRRAFHYPPFYRLALLSIGQKPLPEGAVASLGAIGREHGVEVLGPMARPGRGGAYLLKGSDAESVRRAAKAAREAFPGLQVDLDPVWI